MGQITLVRHGQANSAADNEEDYDRLSDLGARQSSILGDYLRAHEASFDVVLRGTLNRHEGTALAMGDLGAAPDIDPRLDEMDYMTLGRVLEEDHGVPRPGPGGFAEHFVKVLTAWKEAQIMGRESYDSFETRVSGVLEAATQPGRRVLCVTSGGVIAMMLRHLLRLDIPAMSRVCVGIYNTSVHRIEVTPHGSMLWGFNDIAHLADPKLAELRTHY